MRSRPAISCLLVSHDKPDFVGDAIRSVLAQDFADWEAVVFDSGELYDAGYYARVPGIEDPRLRLVRSWETPEIRRTKAIAPWCFNECLRKGLVRGELVVYLTDDDVFYPHAFRTFVEFRRRHPEVLAMYGAEDMAIVHADGQAEIVGERRATAVGGQCCRGSTLAGFVDYLQFCHARAVLERFPSEEYWPERLDTQHYGDALFMERVGSLVPVVPVDAKIGQNRRTPRSKYGPVTDGGGGKSAVECSLIIPVHNQRTKLARTLLALAAVGRAVRYEVIVVDNASTDDTEAVLGAFAGDVQVVRNQADVGPVAGFNQGAERARGELLVFLAAGAVPGEGWLDALVAETERTPQVAVVGAKVVDGEGKILHAGIGFSRDDGEPYAIYHGCEGSAPAVNRPRELQAVSGACLLVRRQVFAAVGGFDARLGPGTANVDLCLKVGELGRGVSYDPRCVLCVPEGRHEPLGETRTLRARWGHKRLEDEDTIFVKDGYRLVRDGERGAKRPCLVPLAGADESVRWARVGFVQRFVGWGELGTARPLLSRPEDWPADSSVLRWAARVCTQAGWPAQAQAFMRRLDRREAPA